MIVVNPDNTTHTTKLIPRFAPTGSVVYELFNETTRESDTPVNSYVFTDGILSITYDFNFENNSKYQIKIIEGESVIFRGKLIATNQTPQDYKSDDGIYTYSQI